MFKCETTKIKLAKNIKKSFQTKTFLYNVIIFYEILILVFITFLMFSFINKNEMINKRAAGIT